ncbi:F-actin-capping protein [Entomortierella chlamydospora]|uniref:F-actin-capping protein subunit alpha n=1 Tax=Entomortierella chlamydospora TaxID=101097 RepID=A0A9P6MMK1_9FUNG|nr:F-actin-capping protein [Entomortierella chlamydospora]
MRFFAETSVKPTRLPLLLGLLLTVFNPSAVALPDSISLSFLDEDGAVIGQPQTISYASCAILEVSQLVSNDGVYATARTSDLRSALNLYKDSTCQILVGSTVGEWANVAPVANMVAIRWEGTADSTLTTGVIRPDGFPKGMSEQTKVDNSSTSSETQLILDPSKGKLLVGLVAAVLVVGVIIGAYQVYQASLYEAPPKEKKEKKPNGLNTKKIKKKDAYFKKPIRNDQQAFQRLESPAPSVMTRPPMSERRGFRDSQLSEAPSSVELNQQRSMYNNGSDTVMIDMHGAAGFRSSQLRENGSALNLIQFESDSNNSYGRVVRDHDKAINSSISFPSLYYTKTEQSIMATVEEKIKIASGFLKTAPPDVRGLVGDDELLDGGILNALAEYNTEELATAIVSKHGQIENDLFLHPKTNKVFKLDHFRQIASDPVDHTVDEGIEELRKTVEKDTEEYVADRYAEGVSAIYGSNGGVTIAIVHNKYSPSNFWNGRWRSIWTLDTATLEVKGTLKCKVHYYEDGNVQLETSKEVEEKLNNSSSDPPKVISKAFLELIAAAELKYQTALNESYHDLAENTFNGLRRALPYTRTKLDWNKACYREMWVTLYWHSF